MIRLLLPALFLLAALGCQHSAMVDTTDAGVAYVQEARELQREREFARAAQLYAQLPGADMTSSCKNYSLAERK